METCRSALTILLLFLLACSKPQNGGKEGVFPGPKADKDGPYSIRTSKLIDSKFKANCDESWHQIKIEMAGVLDGKRAEITKFASEVRQAPATDFEKIGPFVFLKDAPPPNVPFEGGNFGWSEVVARYAAVKAEGSPENWISFQRKFDFLLSTDEFRLIDFRNYDMPRDGQQKLRKLILSSEKCNESNFQSCLNADDMAFIKSVETFKDYWTNFESKPAGEKWAKFQQMIKNWKWDWNDLYAWDKNPLVRKEGKNIIIPMRTKDFESIKNEIKAVIEKFWKFEDRRLIVEWSTDERATEIKKSPVFAARAIGSRKEIIFPEGRPFRVIAHEVGHSLGLPDDYYTLFSSADCSYFDEVETGNIMSSSSHGFVLKKHFERLDELYQ
jgi:hypothetical protein